MRAHRAWPESPIVAEAIKLISDPARDFLRSVRIGGGRVTIAAGAEGRALECRQAGYLHISEDSMIGRLTGLGQAYLDRLMRAH